MPSAVVMTPRPAGILLDLLMATMDSVTAWSDAAGDASVGLAWRDGATRRMIEAGRYVPYERLVAASAADVGLPAEAVGRLWDAWDEMRPWPDAAVLHELRVPYAFVTNTSTDLAARAVRDARLHPAFTLSAEEAGWYKPSPEIYAQACVRLAVDPASVRYVAGAPYDATGAAEAGLPVRLVTRRPATGSLDPRVAVVASLHEATADD